MIEPFPSAPTRIGRYEVRIESPAVGLAIHIFHGRYAARKFIEAAVDLKSKEKYNLGNDQMMIDGIRIRSSKLRAILNHEYTPDEAAWQLPLPYNYYARRIRTGTNNYSGDTTVPPSPKSAPVKSSPKPSPKSSSKTGVFGPQEIASHLKVSPSKVRQALRRKLTKPSNGWEWSSDQFDEILKKLGKV